MNRLHRYPERAGIDDKRAVEVVGVHLIVNGLKRVALVEQLKTVVCVDLEQEA